MTTYHHVAGTISPHDAQHLSLSGTDYQRDIVVAVLVPIAQLLQLAALWPQANSTEHLLDLYAQHPPPPTNRQFT